MELFSETQNEKTNPRFNLGVVLRETGVNADTLRAWERRYGLPTPHRSESGQRLYSQQDINTIKWLISRQKEGMRISNAVELWKKIITDGEDPFRSQSEFQPAAGLITQGSSGTDLESLQNAWVEACLQYDEAKAEQVLTQSFALYPLEMVCTEVIEKGLQIIGEEWYKNNASAQQEHFAVSLAARKINSLIAAAPRPFRKERLIIGCTPGETHSFPGLLLTLLSRYRGWEVIYLGADVPHERLDATIQITGARIIILTAMQLHTAAYLFQIAEKLKDKDVLLGFGGYIFEKQPELDKHIPGFYLGNNFLEAIKTIEYLSGNKPAPNQPPPLPDVYQTALDVFLEKQLLVEAYVLENSEFFKSHADYSTVANFFLGEKIKAALYFGNLDYLEFELDYSKELLSNRQISENIFSEYIHIYQNAIQNRLGQDGKIIFDWLQFYLTRIDQVRESEKE